MAGKRGSRRHSTTRFSENVVVVVTSHQTLEVLAFCNRERSLSPSIYKDNGAYFSGEKKNNEEFKPNLVLVIVLVLESNGSLILTPPQLIPNPSLVALENEKT